MSAGLGDQLTQRGAQCWGFLACKNLFYRAAVLLQQLQRQEQLAPRRILRQRRNHLHHPVCEAGVAREMLDLVGLPAGNPCGQ